MTKIFIVKPYNYFQSKNKLFFIFFLIKLFENLNNISKNQMENPHLSRYNIKKK